MLKTYRVRVEAVGDDEEFLLDTTVQVQDSVRDKDGVDVPLALQLQLRHALEAARPNEY